MEIWVAATTAITTITEPFLTQSSQPCLHSCHPVAPHFPLHLHQRSSEANTALHWNPHRLCGYLPFSARSMMRMAMVMRVQHLEHMSAELEQKHHYPLPGTSPTPTTRHIALTYSIASHRHSLSCQCQTPALSPEPGTLPTSLYCVDWATK